MVPRTHGTLALVSLLTATVTLVGCATSGSTPLRVYQSPLLAADAQNPRPADRMFDPAEPGDWTVNSETVVAQSEDSSERAKREATARVEKRARKRRERDERKTDKSRRLPTLSTTAVGGYGGADASSSAEAGDYAPPLAAGYVHKSFMVNGVSLPEESRVSVPKLWDACKQRGSTHHGAPLPGDAAFFHNAFDANRDGRNNDWYTHVAIVEDVAPDGTAKILSWRGGRVVELTVNPTKPDDVALNSRLREPTADDAPFTQYHAGQLFAGWCTVLAGKRDVIVIDSWAPENR